MDQARVLTPDAIEAAITTALATIAPEAKLNGRDTRLLGAGAVIDSIGFVSLLVSLEQLLPGQIDLATSYMDQTEREDSENPFSTVGSLASYISAIVAPQP
jgi:acyl carrier protein